MKLEVLISCMHWENTGIAVASHVACDTLIINQCDKEDYTVETFDGRHKVRMISTTERGLSRSRNMAIENSEGDICLICDDDEELLPGYASKIINAFEAWPQADVITFSLEGLHKKFPRHTQKVGYIGILKTTSHQIAFRRKSISEKQLRFDVEMGSGTGNGGGEENKFLIDCLKKGLKIRYVPVCIASVRQESSLWFKGYTNRFFLNRGWTNRRLLGVLGAWLYAVEYTLAKYPRYRKDNTFWSALYFQIKGVYKKRNP